MVACDPALPGTAINTDGKVLAVFDTAPIPSSKAIQGIGSSVIAKGSAMVSNSRTPTPGKAAKMLLKRMPAIIRNIGHG